MDEKKIQNKSLTIAVIAKLNDEKLISKLLPLAKNEHVKCIYLFRRTPLECEKTICISPPGIIKKCVVLSELYRILLINWFCIFRKVDVLMGIQFKMHGILAGVFGLLYRKTVIQNIIESENKIYLSKLLPFFVKKADFIVTRGENTKNFLIKKGIASKRIFIVPNVFDFEKIPIISNAEKKYDLCYIGSLTASKRIDVLLRALHITKIKYKLTNITLAIVGTGHLEKDIRQLVKELNLQENVFFLASLENVYNILNVSKLFIMTSEFEGFPMAIIEALSCGLPCIVPDITNISTVVKHNYNGMLHQFNDTITIADNIHKLLTENNTYKIMSINAFEIRNRKTEYSISNVMHIWDDVIQEIQQFNLEKRTKKL